MTVRPRPARPRVTWVFGATLDGRVAAPDGTSRWISSRAARVGRPPPAGRARRRAGRHRRGADRRPAPRPAPRRRPAGRRCGSCSTPARPSSGHRPASSTTRRRRSSSIGPDAPEPGAAGPCGHRPRPGRRPRPPRPRTAVLDELARARRPLRCSSRAGRRSPARSCGPASSTTSSGYVRAAVLGAGRPLLDLAGVTTIGDLRPFRLVAADVVGDDVRIRRVASG